jgi:hypothetical protein
LEGFAFLSRFLISSAVSFHNRGNCSFGVCRQTCGGWLAFGTHAAGGWYFSHGQTFLSFVIYAVFKDEIFVYCCPNYTSDIVYLT